MLAFKVRQPNWKAVIETQVAQPTRKKIGQVLEAVGAAMLVWLQSRTDEERGWTSRTGRLKGGYSYKVVGTKLILRNKEFYAFILEKRDGRFVLTGVADPGGPVEEKLVEVLARLAPEMTLVRR